MKEMLDKLLAKKGTEIPEQEKNSKLAVLKELQAFIGSMIHDEMNGMQEVTVAADSPENLEKGLSKAQEIVGHEDDEDDEDLFG